MLRNQAVDPSELRLALTGLKNKPSMPHAAIEFIKAKQVSHNGEMTQLQTIKLTTHSVLFNFGFRLQDYKNKEELSTDFFSNEQLRYRGCFNNSILLIHYTVLDKNTVSIALATTKQNTEKWITKCKPFQWSLVIEEKPNYKDDKFALVTDFVVKLYSFINDFWYKFKEKKEDNTSESGSSVSTPAFEDYLDNTVNFDI